MRADDQDKSAPPPPSVKRVLDKAFLGPEFLTWIYFTLLEEGFEITLPGAFDAETPEDDAVVQVQIGKRATLSSLDKTGARVSLSGAGLDDSGELLQSIRRGALVEVLALEVAIGSRVYAFTLRADDGGLVGVKLPDLFSEPDEDEAGPIPLDPLEKGKPKARRPKLPLEDVLALRMHCLDEVERVLDALFARFLTRRLARAWPSEDLPRIRARVIDGLRERLPDGDA